MMIEIKGKHEDYIVNKEDILSIEHFSSNESYVYVKTISYKIAIGESEYERLRRILLIGG